MITNTFTLTLGTCLVATFIGTIPVSAQTMAGAIRATVKEGQKVLVTDDQGRELKGRIKSLTSGSLSLLSGSTSTDIPYDQIGAVKATADGTLVLLAGSGREPASVVLLAPQGMQVLRRSAPVETIRAS